MDLLFKKYLYINQVLNEVLAFNNFYTFICSNIKYILTYCLNIVYI
jgi:hypothetical protein